MEPLDFQEIAQLLNHSRTTHIDLKPVKKQENGWALYQGHYKVHTSTYPFRVLYLHSGATREAIEAGARDAFVQGETHVVYPPSLDDRQSRHHDLFSQTAKGYWTTKEYLASFIRDELQAYISKLEAQAPQFYIDPRVETPAGFVRKIPNPLYSLLAERDPGGGKRDGALGILLAEPGQGKTYMSRYLVSTISKRRPSIVGKPRPRPRFQEDSENAEVSHVHLVPIMIDSTQWHAMSVENLSSLWKTIAHSFRHFDAPISWLEGHEDEFLRATLKAEIFRVVFDGFDEYVLRNRGSVQPLEVLEALAELAETTGARILITSRTSFRHTNLPEAEVQAFIDRTKSLVYRILPFDMQHARNYFAARFRETKSVESAIHLYSSLRRQNEELVGRGFVLSLIADLVGRGHAQQEVRVEGAGALLWLMDALCQRETLRQQLLFTSQEQLAILRVFVTEKVAGQEPNTELLDLAIQDVRSDLGPEVRGIHIEKLKSHPLLERRPSEDRWQFKQEQIEIALLADLVVGLGDQELLAVCGKTED